MLRRYVTEVDIISELKTHLILGQWEVVEAFIEFLVGEEEKRQVTEILTSVALQPQLNSYCLEANVRNPEHLAFLAAQCLGDEKLIKDAAFRYLLRNIPQLDDEIKYLLLESYTQESVPEQRVLNALRQHCLVPRPSISLFIVLEVLKLPYVTLECVQQVCVEMQRTNSDWSIDQLMDKLQELIGFTSSCNNVPDELVTILTDQLVEAVLPRRAERLMSLAIGCRNISFQRKLLQAISDKECILSQAKAQGNQHFLELHLDNLITAMVNNSKLPKNLPGVNLLPLALMFSWEQLSAKVAFTRLDELERRFPKDPLVLRMATIVRECRLISSVTKTSTLLDLVGQRQTQSLLRVVYSTGALRGMKDAQVMHIVNDDYQSHILRGVLALKHVSAALHFAILIAERRIDRNSIFQPRSSDLEPKLDNTHDIVKYIEQHGPDVSFDALVTPELSAMEDLLLELPSNELKVEVLENIFSLLFISHRELHEDEAPSKEDIQTNKGSSRYKSADSSHCIRGSGFLAPKKFIRTLLPVLLTHIHTSKLNLPHNEDLPIRLETLLAHVTNARWRLELVEEQLPLSIKYVENIEAEDLSNPLTRGSGGPSTSPGVRKRRTARVRTKSYIAQMVPRAPQASVVELMLSTMDALLRHCLWKGDYERALQVRQFAMLDNTHATSGAELEFCLAMPQIEEELIRIQKANAGSSVIFSAIDSFLQARPLLSNFESLCRFYMNLAFTSGLSLAIAHKLLTYSADLSKDNGTSNAYQAINKGSSMLASLCEKLADTHLTLNKALNLSTCHLDGVQIRNELTFWKALRVTLDKVGKLLCQEQEKGSSISEVYQEFFRLGKMVGTEIRKYRTRLSQFNFDFTRALYAHARQVYKALEEKQQSLCPEQRNCALLRGPGCGCYFRVLEECSPSMTLLKLILHDQVSPTKLEEFASNMKLNITQCVSKEILSNIYMRTTTHSDSLTVKVLNADRLSSGVPFGSSNSGSHKNSLAGTIQTSNGGNQFSRNASFVAKKMLSQLIDILRERCPCPKKLVMERYDNLREVAFWTQFERWRESTRELSNVDLTKLNSEERIPFFLNVLHCLTLERFIHRYRKGLPLIQSTLERQIDESLYGYEIGCMGVVTILQLKYSILFCGHSLPRLAAPLTAAAAVAPQPFLPAQSHLTVFSLVQCCEGDPPLRVIETEDQLNEGFAKAIPMVKVDNENKKLYVPWQMEEIIKGKYFMKDADWDIQRITGLKMNGSGLTLDFVRPSKFFLNLHPASFSPDICKRQQEPGLQLPLSVVRYMEQHCAPVGVILQLTAKQRDKVNRNLWTELKGNSALERILDVLPDAKETVLSGNIAEDIWNVLESSDSLVKMLDCIDFCDAICGNRLVTSKLYYLKQQIFKILTKEHYCYLLRLDNSTSKAAAFVENYINWLDKDIENATKALKSVVPKSDTHYAKMITEMERILLYQSIGRLLHIEWRLVVKDIPWVISKLREGNHFDFIHKISSLGLVDPSNTQLNQTVTELSTYHQFSLACEEHYFAGLRTVDSISDIEARLAFCRRLLYQLTPCRGKLYLLRYMISIYFKEEALVKRLKTQALGLEALLIIPVAQRWEYLHLDEWPELIIEALLMNGRLDLVDEILARSESLTPEFIAKVDGLCEVFAKKALELSNITTPHSKRSSVNPSVQRCSVSSFVMPKKTPSVKEWVRDQEITKCMICRTKFTFLVRKHHCRRCGRVVCNNCSSRGGLMVQGYGEVPVRVCDDCFVQTTDPEVVEATEAIETFTPNSFSKKVTPFRVTTTWCIKEPIGEDNREFNATTRRIFCYEQAPSVSLCLSILDRHSNLEKAVEFILSLCDRLVPLLGSPSEIDHGQGIAMLQTLLLKARFNLLKINREASLEWCDSYLQTLDLLKLLVKNNCQDLIPKEVLQQKGIRNKDWRNVHRKLRDKLLDAERFQLALEVSIKCNLEESAVQAAWGLSMLKAGDWSAAREKLVTNCLRRPLDVNNSKTESPLLKDILAVLENSTYAGVTKSAAVYCTLANLKNIKANGIQHQTVQSMDHLITVATESWFYLERFACHSTIISYLSRKKDLKEALEYCLNHKCENQIFVENLFIPCLRTGSLELFFQQMQLIEHCLTKFNSYLLSLCIYLERHNYVNTLYRVQIFMEDWMRAAMTSINFFESETASLSMKEVAAEKLHHLADAKKYLELFLQRSLENDQKSSEDAGQHSKRIKDIYRHLSTVSLQIDVCRYLACREEAQNGFLITLLDPPNPTKKGLTTKDKFCPCGGSSGPQPTLKPKPTLFSTDVNVKHNLATMILLNGSSVENGFGLCMRVVTDCQLDGMDVLRRAVEFLARAGNNEEVNLDEIQRLSKCVQQSGYNNDLYNMDKVFIAVIATFQKKNTNDPEKLNVIVDSLLKLISDDMNKIVAYTESGRLRSAYMLAVRLGQVDGVRRIREKATQLKQTTVYKMCDKWLQNRR